MKNLINIYLSFVIKIILVLLSGEIDFATYSYLWSVLFFFDRENDQISVI